MSLFSKTKGLLRGISNGAAHEAGAVGKALGKKRGWFSGLFSGGARSSAPKAHLGLLQFDNRLGVSGINPSMNPIAAHMPADMGLAEAKSVLPHVPAVVDHFHIAAPDKIGATMAGGPPSGQSTFEGVKRLYEQSKNATHAGTGHVDALFSSGTHWQESVEGARLLGLGPIKR